MSVCHKFVFWKICPIILIVFISMLIKYLGKILDYALSKVGSFTTIAWFAAFAASRRLFSELAILFFWFE